MVTTTSTLTLQKSKAPALPYATREYSESALNQHNNILRIYFNQLDNIIGQLVSTISTGVPITFPDNAIDAFGRLVPLRHTLCLTVRTVTGLMISLTQALLRAAQLHSCLTSPQFN